MAYSYRSSSSRYGRRPRRSFARRRPTYTARRAYSRYRVAAPRRVSRRRPAYQRRSRRAQSSGMHTGGTDQLDPGEKFVLAQADPFEPRCFGGKIPDSSTIPSISTPIQYNQTLSTSALAQKNYAGAWAFYPTLQNAMVAAVGVNVSTWSFASGTAVVSDAPQAASFGSAFEATRPVAHAIRLSCPFAPTSTTGFVHVALATETTFVGSTGNVASQYTRLATTLGTMSGYTFYKRVTLASLTQSPLTIVNKWTDETAFRYNSPYAIPQSAGTLTVESVANQFHIPFSWGTLLIAVEGVSADTTLAAQSPLQAEVILHTESIPDKAGVLIGSTAAAYSSGILNSVSQAVAQTDFSHTEDQQQSYMDGFAQQVQSAAANSGIDLSAFGRNLGRRAVNYGLNAAMNYAAGFGVGGVNNNPNRLLVE